MEITFQAIVDLVANSEPEGDGLTVTFKCPSSGVEVISHGTFAQSPSASAPESGTLAASVRRSVFNVLRGVMGRSGASKEAKPRQWSEEEKAAAIIHAFEAVQTQFVWLPDSDSWMSVEAAGADWTEFAKQLYDGPVSEENDRQVLARMLVEIANADGHLADAEKRFLNDFLSPDLGSMDELSQRPLLSAAELGSTTPGKVRDTMLMVAWAVAFVDQDLDAREAARLDEHARGLGLGPNLADELKRYAQAYVIDQALDTAYRGDQRDETRYLEVKALRKKLGLPRPDFERVEARLRKRRGLT